MTTEFVGLVIYLLFFIMGVGYTFYPARSLSIMVRLVEILCAPNGEDCRNALRKKYDPLLIDPQAYAELHPMQMLYSRIIGVLLLIFTIAFFISNVW